MNTILKSVLNATWKVGIGLFGITALIVGILIFDVWYDNSYGRNYRYDKNLSKDIAVHNFNGNRARVWNRKTNSYVTPKLRWVSGTPLRDSLTVYCDVDGNRGYINCNTGAIVIPAEKARYRRAWQFSEGLAFVVLRSLTTQEMSSQGTWLRTTPGMTISSSTAFARSESMIELAFFPKTAPGRWNLNTMRLNVPTPVVTV